jgi:tRNA(Arg) A34 adenosine deaminase TadA
LFNYLMNLAIALFCSLLVFLVSPSYATNGGGDNFSTRGVAGNGAFHGFTIVKPHTHSDIDNIDAREFDDEDIIPEAGVSKECLVMLDNIAWQVQMNAYGSLCPKATFGALIVNFNDKSGSVRDSRGRSCGRIISTNNGVKTTTDVTEHSEMDAMRRLAYHHMGERANLTLWQPLAVITPGSSCPMDASAIRWANMRWHVASLSIRDLIALNFTQIAVEPEYILERTGTITSPPAGVIKYVNREANIARFAYRNILSNPCLPGCHRLTPSSLCTDINPFTLTPEKLIPDVNYYVAPGVFQLV